MKLLVPDYYPEFRCIAQNCRRTCCAGWEIDIDDDTAGYYQETEGAIGARLRTAMETDDDGTIHFRLLPGDRCPMLRKDGLCDVICELGEDALCQICSDHPRWRSYFSGRTEMGLGLCCEEAARIILTRKQPVRMMLLEDDG